MDEARRRRNELLANIKIVATDCDGCLTDGKLYIGSDGEMFKVFSVKDGQGVRLLQANGIVPAIITTRNSAILERRARELDIDEVFQSVGDKAAALQALAEKYGVNVKQIAYIGDDMNDLDGGH
mgnify:FL=1